MFELIVFIIVVFKQFYFCFLFLLLFFFLVRGPFRQLVKIIIKYEYLKDVQQRFA